MSDIIKKEKIRLTPLEVATNSDKRNTSQAQKKLRSNAAVFLLIAKMIELYFSSEIPQKEKEKFDKEKEQLIKSYEIIKLLPENLRHQ